ncbi:MAG TPA: DNA polymerase IV [Puia sp.]|nr:DNA polymerase IV [Puia sp.]
MNLDARHITHFDLDAFFVAVECLKNAKFKSKPLLVGGKGDRAVVAACSYEARKFGIYCAMPMRLAKKLCPEAIVISGDMENYSKHSRVVTNIIAESVPLYEKTSIDEFYLDLTGMDKFFGCNLFSEELKEKITKETGLSVSFALASNKLISKVATGEVKPNGQIEIPFGEEKKFIAPLNVEKLPGIGRERAEMLYQMGVEKIDTLSKIPVGALFKALGKEGIEFSRKANGIDETPVIPYREHKSISTEKTFQTDTINIEFLHSALVRMTEEIAFELRKQNKLTGCVTVKLRYANSDTVSRELMICYTAADDVLLKVALELFDKLFERRMLIRLLGIRFTHLIPGNYQINLFEDTCETIKLYRAIDSVKYRYGPQFLRRAKAIIKSQ